MAIPDKLKRDGAPIALFALIIAAKTYYLFVYFTSTQNLWALLGDIGSLGDYGPKMGYYLTGQLSYLLYYIIALAFDALVLYSFIVRVSAKHRPRGFWENVFPLLTVFVPVIGFTLLFLPEIRSVLPDYAATTLQFFGSITPAYGFYLHMIGVLFGLVGAAFSIWAISHLKRSFGLRTAVRTLVTSGPYQRIRHPLYVGEIMHIFGIAILSGKPAGMYLFIAAVVFQVARAKIEERKFLHTLPEYAAYKKSTGFLWPSLSSAAGKGLRPS